MIHEYLILVIISMFIKSSKNSCLCFYANHIRLNRYNRKSTFLHPSCPSCPLFLRYWMSWRLQWIGAITAQQSNFYRLDRSRLSPVWQLIVEPTIGGKWKWKKKFFLSKINIMTKSILWLSWHIDTQFLNTSNSVICILRLSTCYYNYTNY